MFSQVIKQVAMSDIEVMVEGGGLVPIVHVRDIDDLEELLIEISKVDELITVLLAARASIRPEKPNA